MAAHRTDTDVDDLAAVAARELVVGYSRMRRRLQEVAGGGLTPSQTSVLVRLDKSGPASASELAGAERIRPQSMAATLAALDEQGLIRRERDPEDGRRMLVSLTATGLQHATGGRREREDWLARTLREVCTEPELRAILVAAGALERVVGV
jgi:DNA-binding MarR family transcriptional regulator